MNKNLVVIGGGPGSLGEAFADRVRDEYLGVENFDLSNGFNATDPAKMKVAAAKAEKNMSFLSAKELHVVNFVGIMRIGSVADMNLKDFQESMYVNLYSAAVVAHAFDPVLRASNGRFVQIGSNAGEQAFSTMGAYCATKHGLQGLIKVWAREMARDNVPVNILNPGAFEPGSSRMSSDQVARMMDESGMTEQEVGEMLTSRIPMKRLATVEDLSMALRSILAMPRYYTGQAVSLSGGMVM